jgi:hypothetical protein
VGMEDGVGLALGLGCLCAELGQLPRVGGMLGQLPYQRPILPPRSSLQAIKDFLIKHDGSTYTPGINVPSCFERHSIYTLPGPSVALVRHSF